MSQLPRTSQTGRKTPGQAPRILKRQKALALRARGWGARGAAPRQVSLGGSGGAQPRENSQVQLDRGLGAQGGAGWGQGVESVINTWHSAGLHLKGLGQSRLVPRVHPLVAESWEGFGGPGRGVGWQRRGTWAAQGKSYLSTIMEIFWYFNNQYRHTSACGVNTMDTRDSHMQQRLGALF